MRLSLLMQTILCCSALSGEIGYPWAVAGVAAGNGGTVQVSADSDPWSLPPLPPKAKVPGQFMQSTDSLLFADYSPGVSLRENERRLEIGEGANPHWHKNSDTFTTYSELDFQLGFNALQTSAGALAELVGARLEQ